MDTAADVVTETVKSASEHGALALVLIVILLLIGASVFAAVRYWLAPKLVRDGELHEKKLQELDAIRAKRVENEERLADRQIEFIANVEKLVTAQAAHTQSIRSDIDQLREHIATVTNDRELSGRSIMIMNRWDRILHIMADELDRGDLSPEHLKTCCQTVCRMLRMDGVG